MKWLACNPLDSYKKAMIVVNSGTSLGRHGPQQAFNKLAPLPLNQISRGLGHQLCKARALHIIEVIEDPVIPYNPMGSTKLNGFPPPDPPKHPIGFVTPEDKKDKSSKPASATAKAKAKLPGKRA